MNQIAESKVNEVVVNISKVTGDTPTVMKELSAKIRNIVAGDQKIMAMSPEVISDAIIKAMIPDKALNFYKDVYFIPYGKQLNVEFSHNFLCKLAYKSGKVKKIDAYLVFEGDEVSVDENGLHYKINPFDQSGEFKGVLVLVKLSNDEIVQNFITKQHIENAKNASKSKNNGPWRTWYYEMAKKVAIKNTFKSLDISHEIDEAISIDNENTDLSRIEEKEDNSSIETIMSSANIVDEVINTLKDRGSTTVQVANGWVLFDDGILTEKELECSKAQQSTKHKGKTMCKLALLHKCLEEIVIDTEVDHEA
jgi:recombination protein RecT